MNDDCPLFASVPPKNKALIDPYVREATLFAEIANIAAEKYAPMFKEAKAHNDVIKAANILVKILNE